MLLLLTACVINANHYHELSERISSGDRDEDGYADAREGGDDCDDLDPLIHPDADETWENGITDNDCDGECEEVETAFGADALIGEAAGANAGRRLGLAGDIDGDGLEDILVGAWTDPTLYDQGGAAYLVMDAQDGALADHPAIRPSGDGWYVGCALDGGPDLDGDDVPDLIVGALGYEDSTGAVWLVSAAELAAGELVMPDDAIGGVLGSQAGTVAGASTHFLGDLDGDGVEELAVSAQLTTVGDFANAGMVGLFPVDMLGNPTMADAPVQVRGTYTDAYLGAQLQQAGDQDGDGLDDYLVSADNGLLTVILPGGEEAPDLEADAIFRLTAAGEARESAEVRMVGDIDGDGTLDLAAVPLYAGEEELAPQVFFYTALAGTPTRTTAAPSAVIDVGASSYVFDVASAGDLDGDGLDETLVPVAEYAPEGTAALAIHFGETLGINANLDFLDSPLIGLSVRRTAKHGYRALVTDDLNGDGIGDIVLGGASDDEGGEDAGSVTILGLPQ